MVPATLRAQMKNQVHSSNMGAESCLRLAREHNFWPGMSAEIKQPIETCEICRENEISQQKETLLSRVVLSRSWE